MATNGATRIFAGAGHGEGNTRGKYRGGLYRRSPGDGGWEAVKNGLPEGVEVRAIAVHPRDSSVIFAGTQDGPYRSTDGGNRWERLDFPDRNVVIWTLAVHPTRPRIVYAGAAPVALYRSEDGGDTWRKVPRAVSPAHCERSGFDTRTIRITFDPNAPDDVYAALEVSGVIASRDAGETWSDLSASLIELANAHPHLQSSVGGRHCGHCEGMLDSHALAISAAAPGTAFLAIRMGLFRSDDRGATWRDTDIGRFSSPLKYCRDVIVSPHDPRVMYAALSQAAFSTAGSLYRSDDVARTWQRIDHGVKPESTVMAVAVHPADPGRIYCATRGGQVIGTEDSGKSWTDHRLPGGVHDVYAVACV
jgi:photosystem II stability/assembly factor-like uncharacterized protein